MKNSIQKESLLHPSLREETNKTTKPRRYGIRCHPLDILDDNWKEIGSGVYGKIWACSLKNSISSSSSLFATTRTNIAAAAAASATTTTTSITVAAKRPHMTAIVAVKAESGVRQKNDKRGTSVLVRRRGGGEYENVVVPKNGAGESGPTKDDDSEETTTITPDEIYPIMHESVLREIAITRRLTAHPNLALPSMVIYSYKNIPYLLMPLAEINLTKALCRRPIDTDNKRLVPISINAIARCLKDICAGLAHMHRVGIAHCDIFPDNILLYNSIDIESPNVKYALSDFGISASRTMPRNIEPTLISRATTASPELIASSSGMNFTGRPIDLAAIDVWAVGCIGLWMITSEILPWHDISCEYCILLNEKEQKYRDQIPQKQSLLLAKIFEFFGESSAYRFNVYATNAENSWYIDQRAVNDAISMVQKIRDHINPFDRISKTRFLLKENPFVLNNFCEKILFSMLDVDPITRSTADDICEILIKNRFVVMRPTYIGEILITNETITGDINNPWPELIPGESKRPFDDMIIHSGDDVAATGYFNRCIAKDFIPLIIGYFLASWLVNPTLIRNVDYVEILQTSEVVCLMIQSAKRRMKHDTLQEELSCICCLSRHCASMTSILCLMTKVHMRCAYSITNAALMALAVYRRYTTIRNIDRHPHKRVCKTCCCDDCEEHSQLGFYERLIPSYAVQFMATDVDGDIDIPYPSIRVISRLLRARDRRCIEVDKLLHTMVINTAYFQRPSALVATIIGVGLCGSMGCEFLSNKKMRKDMVQFIVEIVQSPSCCRLLQLCDGSISDVSTNPFLLAQSTINMATNVVNMLQTIAMEIDYHHSILSTSFVAAVAATSQQFNFIRDMVNDMFGIKI